MLAAVDAADMQVCIRNSVAFLYQADNNFGNVLADFVEFLNFKSAGEKLVLQLLGRAVDIYIFF